MNPVHQAILSDIRKMVDDSGVQEFLDPYPFRDRPSHLYRCYKWAERILPCRPDADAELTLVSTLMHDIGIIRATRERKKENHDLLGAEIVREYLPTKGYDAVFTARVAELVANHQQRDGLQAEGTPIELVILMEADMLDERGALGIVWDAMAEGAKPEQSYESALERFKTRKLYKHPDRNPMQTEIAREIWREKQRLHVAFVEALERDLGITD